MKENYIQNLLKFEKLCKDLRNLVQEEYFDKNGKIRKTAKFFYYYPIYRQHLLPITHSIEISDFLGIESLERWKSTFQRWVADLEEFTDETLGDFDNVLRIIKKFLRARRQIKETVSLLDSREIDRLNEAYIVS